MKNPLKRITIAFLLIALIPVAFMVYELGLISRNERIVRATYQNQLEAILYSINQYSDDIISSWANRIRLEVRMGMDSSVSARFLAVTNQVDVVQHVYFSDLKGHSAIYNLSPVDPGAEFKSILDQVVEDAALRVEKLIEYERAGFIKVEAIDILISGNKIPVLFALGPGGGEFAIAVLVIDLPAFIVNHLGPKMQAISQEQFIIAAYRSKNDSLVFSTAPINISSDELAVFRDEMQKKDFWLLPGYYLGITLQGATIDDLVRDRTATSLTILILLILILGAGILFLFRNIRREIYLSQAKSEFVSNVSHEIRTPLSLIGMFAETLEMGRVTSEEKRMEYYAIIGKETARLSKMVNRILSFSQLEANKKNFTFEPIQLNDICRDVLRSYEDHLKEKGFVLDFFPDGKVTPIQGDREGLSEAIINLLDNAIKYSKDVKHITIRTGRNLRYKYVEVSDEGIGIAKNHVHEVFVQFFRAPTGDVHNTKGSGLGLTLVKKIMEGHDGQVTVESTLGLGSSFRLNFPNKR